MKRIRLEHRYSGPASQKFWTIVNSLPRRGKWETCYSLGVALQNLESQVLREIEHAAHGTVKTK